MVSACARKQRRKLRPLQARELPALARLQIQILLARPARIERATPGFGGQYSIH
jgi:hypothetical protein